MSSKIARMRASLRRRARRASRRSVASRPTHCTSCNSPVPAPSGRFLKNPRSIHSISRTAPSARRLRVTTRPSGVSGVSAARHRATFSRSCSERSSKTLWSSAGPGGRPKNSAYARFAYVSVPSGRQRLTNSGLSSTSEA